MVIGAVSAVKRLARPKWSIAFALVVLVVLGVAAFVIRNGGNDRAAVADASEDVPAIDDSQAAAAFVGATDAGNAVAIVQSADGEVVAKVRDDNGYAEWLTGQRAADGLRFENDDVVLEAWADEDGYRATLTIDGVTLTIDGVEESLWLSPANDSAGAKPHGKSRAGSSGKSKGNTNADSDASY